MLICLALLKRFYIVFFTAVKKRQNRNRNGEEDDTRLNKSS